MSGGRSIVEYVVGSSVRSDVLRAVACDSRSTDALLAHLGASESAVYGAINELERRGVIYESGNDWEPTGSGQLVAVLLAQHERTEELLSEDDNYWRGHDASVLPGRFRRELADLGGGRVVRATETDPHRVVRTIVQEIEAAERTSIVAPIYQDEYARGLPDDGDTRLILSEAVVDDAQADRIESGIEPPTDVPIRVLDVSFALALTEDCVMLSLPDREGSYDARSEVIAEHDRALDWGRRLYEHCWERAVPVETYLTRR